MEHTKSLYSLIKETTVVRKQFLQYVMDRRSYDNEPSTEDFRNFLKWLYDFFDAAGIIVTVRTSSDLEFVPLVQDKSLTGYRSAKTKVYSRHGLKTRTEAEFIAFSKAFEYLETKLKENE